MQPIEVQVDLDTAKIHRMFVTLMTASTLPRSLMKTNSLAKAPSRSIANFAVMPSTFGVNFYCWGWTEDWATQCVHKLLNLMALALCLLRRLLGQLLVDLNFLLSFQLFPRPPIGLRQAIVRLLQPRIGRDCILIGDYCSRKIPAVGVENSQLQIGVAELRIDLDSFFQQRLHLREF